MTVERVHRWDVALAATVVLIAIGVVTFRPVLVVAGAVPMLYVIVGALSTIPETGSLTVDRSLDISTPTPGDRVDVTLTIRNTGNSAVMDARIVDGVPKSLVVSKGSPRSSLSLRPGDESSLSYTVVARRGEHTFHDPVIRVRCLPATVRRTESLVPTGTSVLDCRMLVEEVPLQNETTRQVGALATDTPGVGIEFYSTRQYRRGDAVRRIDWRQFAKSRDLTTVQYREQRAAQVVLVVDSRDSVYRSPLPGYPDGAELVSYAADRTYTTLRSAGHHVGLLAVGIDPDDVDAVLPTDSLDIPWVAPETTAESAARVRSVLEAILDAKQARQTKHLEGNGGSYKGGGCECINQAFSILGRFSTSTQVVLLSPLVDDEMIDLARQLSAEGYPLTVISPNITSRETMGQSIEQTHRTLRLETLRGIGVSTIDWDPERPLRVALVSALEGVFRR